MTKSTARKALNDRDQSRIRLAEKWNHALEPAQDHMWRTVLELIARMGTSSHLYDIGEETGFSAKNLRMLVAELQAHDLLGIHPSADVVLYAYPFISELTKHCVQLDELVLASATTIHKSQGSEYPAIVIPLSTQHYSMLAIAVKGSLVEAGGMVRAAVNGFGPATDRGRQGGG